MQKKIALFLILLLIFSTSALAHSGRTDSDGGHYDHYTGEYHYHHGQGPHQHPNGICPYETTNSENENSVISFIRQIPDIIIFFIVAIIVSVTFVLIVTIKEKIDIWVYKRSRK